MAIASSSDLAAIESILGDDAESLLSHECTTIPTERLHLPGPDFVDRMVAASDRPTPVLRSIQTLFDHLEVDDGLGKFSQGFPNVSREMAVAAERGETAAFPAPLTDRARSRATELFAAVPVWAWLTALVGTSCAVREVLALDSPSLVAGPIFALKSDDDVRPP